MSFVRKRIVDRGRPAFIVIEPIVNIGKENIKRNFSIFTNPGSLPLSVTTFVLCKEDLRFRLFVNVLQVTMFYELFHHIEMGNETR